ncbi:GNAT family N-acetyltransferase [Coprococcus sp. AF21-14LB]|uniref:GNAT family N-acetyltransferase n=1 Tax=Coprococcus sp. AF21-14LB TaxID=2292231 RepID=UPI0013142211|nr:GNAT family N-acetyltransferase [Coprococcus sp. AF21-14LB]
MIRKLEQEEHKKTRKLWEEIFCEDSKKFLDYYYSVKTKENEIFIIEEDGDIRAMLQLNPYEMVMPGGVKKTNYIVGVATEKAYRGRKFMARLLHRALEEMYREHQPLPFLCRQQKQSTRPMGSDLFIIRNAVRLPERKGNFRKGFCVGRQKKKIAVRLLLL